MDIKLSYRIYSNYTGRHFVTIDDEGTKLLCVREENEINLFKDSISWVKIANETLYFDNEYFGNIKIVKKGLAWKVGNILIKSKEDSFEAVQPRLVLPFFANRLNVKKNEESIGHIIVKDMMFFLDVKVFSSQSQNSQIFAAFALLCYEVVLLNYHYNSC